MIKSVVCFVWGFPGRANCEEPSCSAGDLGSIPGSGRSPEEGNGYPFQYSYLENSTNRGSWLQSMQYRCLIALMILDEL